MQAALFQALFVWATVFVFGSNTCSTGAHSGGMSHTAEGCQRFKGAGAEDARHLPACNTIICLGGFTEVTEDVVVCEDTGRVWDCSRVRVGLVALRQLHSIVERKLRAVAVQQTGMFGCMYCFHCMGAGAAVQPAHCMSAL